MLLLSTCCVLSAVIPTIEKLLNADWKEKLLDKSTVVAGQLKGQLQHTINSVLQSTLHTLDTLLTAVAIACLLQEVNTNHVSILRCNFLSTILISRIFAIHLADVRGRLLLVGSLVAKIEKSLLQSVQMTFRRPTVFCISQTSRPEGRSS